MIDRHIARAASFAGALAVPTVAWPVRRVSKSVERLLWAEMVALFPSMTAAWMLVSFATVKAVTALSGAAAVQGIGDWVLLLVLMSVVLTALMAFPIAMILVLVKTRWFMSNEALGEFLLYSLEIDRWRGVRPGRWNFLARFRSALARLAARIARIPLPSPLQSELRHGMTPARSAVIASTQ